MNNVTIYRVNDFSIDLSKQALTQIKTDLDYINAIKFGADIHMHTDLAQCCLYAQWQTQLLSECGGTNTKAYKERSAKFMKELNIKKAQLMKNVQIGKFILANKETKPEILEMAKTNIYLTYINPPKLPDPNKPKKPSKLDLLQEENEKLKADIQKLKASNKPVPKFKGNWKADDGIPYETVYSDMEKLLKWIKDNPKHAASWNKLLETAGIKHAVFMVNVENQK